MYITRIYIYSYKWIEDRSPSPIAKKSNKKSTKNLLFWIYISKRQFFNKEKTIRDISKNIMDVTEKTNNDKENLSQVHTMVKE